MDESEPLIRLFSVPTTNRLERRESDTDNGWWRKQVQVQVQVRKRTYDGNDSVNDNYFTNLSNDLKLVKLYDQLNVNNNVIRKIEAKQDECMINIQVVQRSTEQTKHIIS